MARKQLAALFVTNLIPYTAAIALLALMPVYLKQLGMSSVNTGIVMAAILAALSAGSLSAGWLTNRFGRRKPILLAGVFINAPLAFLMGTTGDIRLFMLLAMGFWFVGGVQVSLVNMLTAMFAEERQRGRIFGIIGAGTVLAQLLAGLAAGPIVDRWGFAALFTASAVTYLTQAAAIVFIQDKPTPRAQPSQARRPAPALPTSHAFGVVLAATVLISVARYMVDLGRPMMMAERAFDSAAITGAVAASGAINLPLLFLTGWLSDRLGRRWVLAACYLGVAVGVGLLGVASSVWHFWLAQVLVMLVRSGVTVGSAFVADLVPAEQRGMALARFSVAPCLGGIAGYAFTGLALQTFGTVATFSLGAVLPLLAILLLAFVHPLPALPLTPQPAVSAPGRR